MSERHVVYDITSLKGDKQSRSWVKQESVCVVYMNEERKWVKGVNEPKRYVFDTFKMERTVKIEGIFNLKQKEC